MKTLRISIAGIGNIGSHLVHNLSLSEKFFINKSSTKFEIIAISAKNKNKKRKFNIDKYKWCENPLDLISDSIKPDILIELIGNEDGISYKLIKDALKKNIHVVTANKALLAKYGNELFELADQNQVLLLFEAAVAGGIPVVRTIKHSLFLSKIKKISGILNGTTNYILSEMNNKNTNLDTILKSAQEKGFAESDSKNDIEGIDAAHKLTILSSLCFGIKFNFNNVVYKGISSINIQDIKFAKQLGYTIKLIGSSEIINNKITNVVEPTLVKNNSKLANVHGVLNGIKIETEHLKSLFLEGEGAGGMATTNSIISDLFEIANDSQVNSLGYKTMSLKAVEKMKYEERACSYYIRILVKDIPGVLAKITSNLNNEGISIETILQLPENNISDSNIEVPIIMTTHETTFKLLNKAIMKIENLDFVVSNIIISIDKNLI